MTLRICVCLATAVAVVGCGVSKSEHQTVVDARDMCMDESARWESLYQESVEERQQALDEALSMLPTAHDELRTQIDTRLDQVTKELDEAIKAEVQESFYDLADAIAEGYNVLQQENKQLTVQLAESRSLIETVLEKTGTIEQRVGMEQDAFSARRQALLLEIGGVESFLRDWSYRYVECQSCEERLRINKRERDALAQLSEDLMSRLSGVRAQITEPAEAMDVDADESSDETAAGDEETGP